MQKLAIVFEPCQEGGFRGYVKEIPGRLFESIKDVFGCLSNRLALRVDAGLSRRKGARLST